ncbi:MULTISPECIES: hypothetical protein [Natrinema]|uniref:Uncharacterized protein n=1 Tax=Natrinema gari JCM 14663 TaxID=1230459 RepID=L9ZF63_9EURY|nr:MULTISPECIES: hypothetical protein [Natrinema]AFO56123.1 hypothetical protein NJ7G_0874 [Natrinema sp. J7-2]ELY83838.1 hypothetical protein C486_01374 [Natrinema gari JCM 14663]
MIVIPILGPQLYLAATDGDDEFAPRTRVRTAVGVSLFLLLSFSGVAGGTDRTLVGLLAAGLLIGYLASEGVGGYRSTREVV